MTVIVNGAPVERLPKTFESGEHHAYCRNLECTGCLPAEEWINATPLILDLWSEMLACCIAQSQETKSLDGARRAILQDRPSYRVIARFCRYERQGGREVNLVNFGHVIRWSGSLR